MHQWPTFHCPWVIYSSVQKGDFLSPTSYNSHPQNPTLLHSLTYSTIIIFTFQVCPALQGPFPQPVKTTTNHLLPPIPAKCESTSTPNHPPLWNIRHVSHVWQVLQHYILKENSEWLEKPHTLTSSIHPPNQTRTLKNLDLSPLGFVNGAELKGSWERSVFDMTRSSLLFTLDIPAK